MLIGVCCYYNFLKPIKIEPKKVVCQNWDATYVSIKAFEEMYLSENYNKSTTVIHSFQGKLPSENPKDYMTVYISLEAKNRCWFDSYIVDGSITEIGKYKEMALFSYTLGEGGTIQVFHNSVKEGTIVLDIYIGNHTDEEIKEFIRSISIETISKGKIMNKKKSTISLENMEEITIER